MSMLYLPVLLPMAAGFLLLAAFKLKFKLVKEFAALAVSAWMIVYSIKIYRALPLLADFAGETILRADSLSALILIPLPFFAVMTIIYAVGFFGLENAPDNFYGLLLLTLGAAAGIVLSNNILVLLVFWGFMGLTLFLMAYNGSDDSAAAAKKSLVIVGGTDALFILGATILYFITGTMSMNEMSVDFSVWIGKTAYLLLLCAGLAKAGAFPFHTWVPEIAKSSSVPVAGYLPASLDKLVGVYFIARISMDIFVMNSFMSTIVMGLGAVTIIVAVMMALVQHDLKSLLGYHAVSQVGYMVLGIGTGGVLGIAGGLFHMINNAVYKTALFFTAGAVEKKAGTTDLDKLGGLVKYMPYSFAVAVAASFAISGIPPFSGFFSKWMIYQGIIQKSSSAASVGFADHLWILWLAAAMFGSALTLASFLKVLHAVFLGKESGMGSVKEAPFTMILPMGLLAGLCLVFGIGAKKLLPVTLFRIFPEVEYAGLWSPGIAAILIIIGIFAGGILYLLGTPGSFRRDQAYIGGEELQIESRITGVDFYKTIEELGFFKRMYLLASKKYFDIYELSARFVSGAGRIFQKAHNGIVQYYVSWCLAGFAALLIYLAVKK